MKTANVATLKQNLSEYLHLVEQGTEVLVTSHRRHVARLIPENGAGLTIRPPTAPLCELANLRGIKLAQPFSAVQTLLDDRTRR